MSRGFKRLVRNVLVHAGGAIATVRGPKVGKRALAFHEVPDAARFGDVLDQLTAEYEVLAMEDWLTVETRDRTQLTLTFDDGYASWHEAVAPMLEERGLPAVFFVTSGLVGLRGRDAREFARNRLRRTRDLRFIGLRQLRDLSEQALFEIGGHTQTHADLGRDDRDAAWDEVAGNRARLEEWLGAPVRWFAYPFGTPGSVSSSARAVVEEAGLSAGFTLIPGWWEPDRGDRFMIRRDALDPSASFAQSRSWLRGGYDRVYALRMRSATRRGTSA